MRREPLDGGGHRIGDVERVGADSGTVGRGDVEMEAASVSRSGVVPAGRVSPSRSRTAGGCPAGTRGRVPHRPGLAPALGLRAGVNGRVVVPQTSAATGELPTTFVSLPLALGADHRAVLHRF